MRIRATINGAVVEHDVPDRLLLSDFLRHELRLTGTRVGCEMGSCGACTVIVEGDAVRSCLMFAGQIDGASVRTVEGLSGDIRALSVVQEAFARHNALQCGYCTPGFLMTVVAAYEAGRLPRTEEEVREFLSGNLCRCTGYQGIVDAVLDLAR